MTENAGPDNDRAPLWRYINLFTYLLTITRRRVELSCCIRQMTTSNRSLTLGLIIAFGIVLVHVFGLLWAFLVG